MSLSFYYVTTYNIQHPTVKKFLGGLLSISESMMEIKTRSKLYHDFIEVSDAAHDDFDLKCESLYPEDGTHEIRWITAINPSFDPEPEDEEVCITNDWQPNCAGSIFFVEVDASESHEEDEDEDEPEELVLEPRSWMFKYELFFVEDIMEVSVNGEAAFSPSLAGCTTSSYH